MIETSALLSLIVQLVIAGLIFWLVRWFLRDIGIPEPFNKLILAIVALVVLVYLVNILLRISGTALFR